MEDLPNLKAEAATAMRSIKMRRNYLVDLSAQPAPYSAYVIATVARKSAEFVVAVEEFTDLLSSILAIPEIDEADPTKPDDLGKTRKKYEEWETELTAIQSATTAAVCRIQAAQPTPVTGDNLIATPQRRSKAVNELKPEKLTTDHTTALMLLWLNSTYVYFVASHFELDPLVVQQEIFFGLMAADLTIQLRTRTTSDLIIYPPNWDSAQDRTSPSCFQLVITHWLVNHPLITNRLKYFQHRQTDGQKASVFSAAHKELRKGCDIEEMTPEDVHIMTMLAGIVDEDMLNELLKINDGKPKTVLEIDQKIAEVEARRSAATSILGSEASAMTAHKRKKQQAMAPKQSGTSKKPSDRRPPPPPEAAGRCFACGKTGHIKSQCPPATKAKLACSNCNTTGNHDTSICFSALRGKTAKVSEVTSAEAPKDNSQTQEVSMMASGEQQLAMIDGTFNPLDYSA